MSCSASEQRSPRVCTYVCAGYSKHKSKSGATSDVVARCPNLACCTIRVPLTRPGFSNRLICVAMKVQMYGQASRAHRSSHCTSPHRSPFPFRTGSFVSKEPQKCLRNRLADKGCKSCSLHRKYTQFAILGRWVTRKRIREGQKPICSTGPDFVCSPDRGCNYQSPDLALSVGVNFGPSGRRRHLPKTANWRDPGGRSTPVALIGWWELRASKGSRWATGRA